MAALTASRLDQQLAGVAVPFLAAAMLLLAFAAAGWWAAGAWIAQALLALAYLLGVLARGGEIDTAAPAVAAALLLAGELAALSRALADGQVATSRELGRRLVGLAALGVASAGAGWVLLAASAAPLPGGPLTTLVGAVAAVAALSLAARRTS